MWAQGFFFFSKTKKAMMVSHNPACLCTNKMGEMKLIEKIDTQTHATIAITHGDWACAAHPEGP